MMMLKMMNPMGSMPVTQHEIVVYVGPDRFVVVGTRYWGREGGQWPDQGGGAGAGEAEV